MDQNLADKVEARAFVELPTHIENSVKSGTFCFKFSVLRQMYKNCLNDLGVNKEINKARFKEQVLDYYSTAQEQSDAKNIFLIFELGMQEMLKRHQATKSRSDCQEDVLTLMKAANIVRNEIFSSTWFKFIASFPRKCQEESVPMSLNLLVTMLLRGSDILDQESIESQACLTVAQTILFNCKKTMNYEPHLPL